jgi:restriction system protein
MAWMNKNSLFAVLARSPWWLSMLVAAGIYMAVRQFVADYLAAFSALPFLVVAGYAGWRQLRAPDAEDVGETLATLRAMSWQEFAALIEEAFRHDGHTVAPLAGGTADFELRKGGRVAIAGCRRWKVAQAGIAPLRELLDAKQAADAHECIYVAAGEVSPNARQFATQNGIRLLSGPELAQFLARARSGKRKPPAAR